METSTKFLFLSEIVVFFVAYKNDIFCFYFLNSIVKYLSKLISWTKFLKYLRLGKSLTIFKGQNIGLDPGRGISKIESLNKFSYL